MCSDGMPLGQASGSVTSERLPTRSPTGGSEPGKAVPNAKIGPQTG